MFVVCNFDALAQKSVIRIERRQVVFLCWMKYSKLRVSRRPGDINVCCFRRLKIPIGQQTEIQPYKPTKLSRLKLETWTQQPIPMMSEHSAHLTLLPFGFVSGSGDIHVCCCQFQCSDTGKRYSNLKETSCLPLLNSTTRPYDEWAFNTLDFTAVWLSPLALAMYMLAVVNFDALAHASDIRI